MAILGALRVSQDTQDVKNQRHGIETYAKAQGLWPVVYQEDVVSSRVSWRKRGIGELLSQAKRDDVIITSEISRMARTTLEALEIAKEAVSKGISIHVVKNNLIIDGSLQSEIIVTVLGLAAQIEREFISTRTKEALARKKAEGKKLGRPRGRQSSVHKLDSKAAEIEKYLGLGVNKSNVCKIVGCSRPTLDSWLARRGIINGSK